MTDIAQALAKHLETVERPGGFQVSGSFDLHPPRLEVDGVGPISMPLLPVQAEALLGVAEQAPYGRGSETLVDTAVRRTWQVDAERVHLTGKRWAGDLAEVVERVRNALAVSDAIEAQLYKLLIYDTGSFFVSHRDTEKAPGMFATLVVVLPCDYSGGELIIRHHGEEVHVDLHRDEPSEAAFAAFYADCRHEVLPIASGHRLALIYNLVRKGSGPLPQPPDYSEERARLTGLLKDWADGDDQPEKLVYPLEHAYTQAEIAFDRLKGRDAAAARVLAAAADDAGCDLHLALISVTETGWAECFGGGYWDDPEMEIGEVDDSDWAIHDWRTQDGEAPGLGPLPFDESEVSPPDALDLEDAEIEFSEATGNEGASFERIYQRAALVLWPERRRASVLTGGGLDTSIPALLHLVRRWESAGAAPDHPLRQQALTLSAAIGEDWPTDSPGRRRASDNKHTQNLLAARLRIGDLEGCAEFIAGPVTAGAYTERDNPALALVLGQLPSERAGTLLERVIRANGARRPGACAGLLARFASADEARIPGLQAPARTLVEALLKTDATASGFSLDSDRWEGTEPLTPEQVAALIEGLGEIDAALAYRAVAWMLSRPKMHPMDKLLLPAALILKERCQGPEPEAVATLRLAVVAHLDARIGEPLEPPADWARDARLGCTCSRCTELARFLASPTEPIWRFKAAESDRRHVTDTVTRAGADLDLTTEKRGRPYTLICTKNQASFERRTRQRERDLANRARLDGDSGSRPTHPGSLD